MFISAWACASISFRNAASLDSNEDNLSPLELRFSYSLSMLFIFSTVDTKKTSYSEKIKGCKCKTGYVKVYKISFGCTKRLSITCCRLSVSITVHGTSMMTRQMF